MMSLLLLLVGLGAFVSADVSQQIVGGVPADYSPDHAHIASLQIRSGSSYYHICGAFIFRQSCIVTAAHCLGSTAGNYRIVVGTNRMDTIEEFQENYSVSSYTMHPQYCGNCGGYPNDVAVMMTSAPIAFNSHVRNISVDDDRGNNWQGQMCKLKGWGRLWGNGPTANQLKKVNLRKISNDQCRERWSGISGATILDSHICFYLGNGYSACNGDSGGPVRCGDTVTGVTSWGISTCSGDFPSVYTRLSYFKQWLISQCGN